MASEYATVIAKQEFNALATNPAVPSALQTTVRQISATLEKQTAYNYTLMTDSILDISINYPENHTAAKQYARQIRSLTERVAFEEKKTLYVQEQLDVVSAIQQEQTGIIESLKVENAGLRSEIGELKVENAGLRSEIEKLKVENAGLRSEIEELKVENAGLRSEIEELKVENAELRQENVKLKQTVSTLTERIDKLENNTDALATYRQHAINLQNYVLTTVTGMTIRELNAERINSIPQLRTHIRRMTEPTEQQKLKTKFEQVFEHLGLTEDIMWSCDAIRQGCNITFHPNVKNSTDCIKLMRDSMHIFPIHSDHDTVTAEQAAVVCDFMERVAHIINKS